jgi:tetratricopeptide (TPR) repeat protein
MRIVGWGVALAGLLVVAASLITSALDGSGGAAAVVKRDPSSVGEVEMELILNRLREGDLHAIRKDLDAARRAWAEARRMGEGLWQIHEGLGDSFARVSLHDEALREYAVAEPLVPERQGSFRAAIRRKRAAALAGAGKRLEAIDAYLDAGGPAAAILALAGEAGAEGAERIERRARTHDPRLHYLLSVIHEQAKRPAEAAESLARYAMAILPWDEALNRRAIEGLRAAKRFDLAVEVCRAWARSIPQALEAYKLMGDLHREAGREREALVAYTSIVDVRPGDAAAHRMLGEIFRGLRRLDDAIGQYEAARKARPEDQQTWTTLIALYEEKGDTARAEEVLNEGVKRLGLQGEMRSRLIALYQGRIDGLKREGKPDEARALRRKLGELNVPELGLFDLKIVMTWDVQSDVDMDVYEPGGERINHNTRQSRQGGVYYVDNTTAYGPETYTLPKAAPGTYRIGAHLHGDRRSTVNFVVIAYEDTPREQRYEESLVLEKGGQEKFIRDLMVAP